MCVRRRCPFLHRTPMIVTVLAGAITWSGCGSDGAGTIHIESAKARKQTMQTGAGLSTAANAKPSPPATVGKPVTRSTIHNTVRKKR